MQTIAPPSPRSMKCRIACLQVRKMPFVLTARQRSNQSSGVSCEEEERRLDAGVRVHRVELAEPLDGGVDEPFSTSSPCVTSVRTNVIASFDGGDALAGLLVDVGDDDLRALRRQPQGDRVPDAAARRP